MIEVPIEAVTFLTIDVHTMCTWLDSICGTSWDFRGNYKTGGATIIIPDEEAAILFRLKFGI